MIYHITTSLEWNVAQQRGVYTTESLAVLGFIHCSHRDQVLPTVDIYFTGQDDLLILCIDPAQLTAPLREDEAPARHENFPHIYGALNLAAVVAALPLTLNGEGKFVLPENMP